MGLMIAPAATDARDPFTVSVVRNTSHEGKLCKVHEYDEAAGCVTSRASALLFKGSIDSRSFQTIDEFMTFRRIGFGGL